MLLLLLEQEVLVKQMHPVVVKALMEQLLLMEVVYLLLVVVEEDMTVHRNLEKMEAPVVEVEETEVQQIALVLEIHPLQHLHKETMGV